MIDLRASGIAYSVLARRRTVYAPKPESFGHRTTRWAHLIGLEEMPPPRLFPAPDQDAAAEKLVPPGPPVIAFGPTANWLGKIWPIERFAELGRRLSASDGPYPGARIAVVGAAGDRDDVAPLLSSVPEERRVDLIGTDLMTAYAALARCALYVGNDSGLLYISVAADIPAVGLVGPSLHLFGPQRPPLVAPWAPKAAIARTPITYEEFISAEGYDHKTTGSLMGSLTVDMVAATVDDLLARLAERAAPTATATRSDPMVPAARG